MVTRWVKAAKDSTVAYKGLGLTSPTAVAVELSVSRVNRIAKRLEAVAKGMGDPVRLYNAVHDAHFDLKPPSGRARRQQLFPLESL